TLDHSLESFRGRSSPPRLHLPARRSRVNSLWLLFAEFLEAWIIPERIEHGIEPEERGSERRARTQCTRVRDREQFLYSSDGAVGFRDLRRHPGEDLDRTWTQ